MAAMVIGFLLGAIAGAAAGAGAGAYVGGVTGLSIGLGVHALGWLRAHSGDAPTLERHRLMCTSSGTFADCELLGDLDRRRWIDVRRCSLQGADSEPACEKSCVRLMNHTGVRPGDAGARG